jgi:predicted nucleic acid-binding protein
VAVIVVDASVAVKWFLPVAGGESNSEPALELLEGVRKGTHLLAAPPHWMAEVAAVLARLSPGTIEEDMISLYALRPALVENLAVYETACRLSVQLRHHLFDTLYHAAALHVPGATLVTADDVYYRKAAHLGQIRRLVDGGEAGSA